MNKHLANKKSVYYFVQFKSTSILAHRIKIKHNLAIILQHNMYIVCCKQDSYHWILYLSKQLIFKHFEIFPYETENVKKNIVSF